MGYKLKRIEVKLTPNEERELPIKLEHENRAAIHGIVFMPDGKTPVKNALVKLFIKKKDHCDLCPVTFAYTDECGQFLFGVDSCVDYVIKVFFYIPEDCHPCDKREECC